MTSKAAGSNPAGGTMSDTREETKSKRWLAIYGAMIAAECMEYRTRTTECVTPRLMRGIMEEAAAIADLEAEAGMDMEVDDAF